jgi:hypothetical protein
MRVLVYQDGRRILQAPGEKITLQAGKNTLGFLVEARTGTKGWTWGKVQGWEPGTYAWVDYKEYNVWARPPVQGNPPAPPPPEKNPCAGITVAGVRKGGQEGVSTIRFLGCLIAFANPIDSYTDAEIQAVLDRRK